MLAGMRWWPIIAAGTAGAGIGFLGTIYVGAAINLGTSLTTTATIVFVNNLPGDLRDLVEMVARPDLQRPDLFGNRLLG